MPGSSAAAAEGVAQKGQGSCHQQGGCQHQHLHCKPQESDLVNPVLGADWVSFNNQLHGREGPA